ncbi:MAG TPA: cation diffusion facilitator family transporter [Candidatus Paceibacterota bacterium]|nr:cation diffusion facilitator family transporter [Candidatus Paceibacterota bacterium]
MSSHAHGKTSVIAALIGNTIVTILKTVMAMISGSTSMFAESVHSFADTLNQSLLLIGIKRSKRPADDDRGYGYGIERFFWSLISACGILFIGAGVTVYHSIDSLLRNEASIPSEFNYITFVVLVIALVVEGATLLIAIREVKGNKKLSRKIFADADPVTLAVVYEDGAAVLGVMVAMLAQALVYITGNNLYDALGGIIVGFILGILAILLIIKNHQYLIGKPLNENIREDIMDFLLKDPCIEHILEFKSTAIDVGKYRIFATVEWNGSPLYEEIYDIGDLREEFDEVREDYSEFAKLMLKMLDRIPRLVGNHIDKIEKQMKERFPEVAYVDIEIN